VRGQHAGKKGVALVTLAAARANAAKLDYAPVKPNKLGVTVLKNLDLAEMANTSTGAPSSRPGTSPARYPKILDDAVVGEAARNVFRTPRPCWSSSSPKSGYAPMRCSACSRSRAMARTSPSRRWRRRRGLPLMTWHGLRQQQERPEGKPQQSLADFVAPAGDYAGAFAVTAGLGIEKKLAEFEAQHDDYRAIMLKSLADRLAEAAAEWLHREVRTNYWGYAADESLDNAALIAEKYQGIRPAPGYPACPDHTAKGGCSSCSMRSATPAWASPRASP
jgi:5-methyltetrahydrofolate--homocysteine methyltransferase